MTPEEYRLFTLETEAQRDLRHQRQRPASPDDAIHIEQIPPCRGFMRGIVDDVNPYVSIGINTNGQKWFIIKYADKNFRPTKGLMSTTLNVDFLESILWVKHSSDREISRELVRCSGGSFIWMKEENEKQWIPSNEEHRAYWDSMQIDIDELLKQTGE